jgi:sulfopyruvate decarboxylase TPP-binding subunit
MKPEHAQSLVDALREAGIDFVAYLPETRMSEILPVLQRDRAFTLVAVASEAEAVGIAAGAALGGKQAAVYMEGTGVFVSAYNLLTVGERYGVPMLLLVSYIGSLDDQRSTFLYSHYGTKMISQLQALGIQYEILKDAQEIGAKIKNAVRMMHGLKQPVALLFTGEFTV